MKISAENKVLLASTAVSASAAICLLSEKFYSGLATTTALGFMTIAIVRNYQKWKTKSENGKFVNRVDELQTINAKRRALLLELDDAKSRNQLHRIYRLRSKIAKLD